MEIAGQFCVEINSPGPLIDIGSLAEGLIFYGRVAIVGNSATIKDVLKRIPPFILLSLMRDGRLDFYYQTDQPGVTTSRLASGQALHSFVQFSSPNHTIDKVAPEAFKTVAGETSQAKLGALQFARLLRPIDHSGLIRNQYLKRLRTTLQLKPQFDHLFAPLCQAITCPMSLVSESCVRTLASM